MNGCISMRNVTFFEEYNSSRKGISSLCIHQISFCQDNSIPFSLTNSYPLHHLVIDSLSDIGFQSCEVPHYYHINLW